MDTHWSSFDVPVWRRHERLWDGCGSAIDLRTVRLKLISKVRLKPDMTDVTRIGNVIAPRFTMDESKSTDVPDLTRGIAVTDLGKTGKVVGKVGDAEVLVVKQGEECFAIGAHCTHYKGPLVDGLVVGDTVRCPWHHACFSLRTGEPLRPPALDPVPRWRVEQTNGRIVVREKLPDFEPGRSTATEKPSWPESVVIVGGGAAGLVAADVLRRNGYDRPITMLSTDDSAPPDRPNLSKDYLAGTAEEDWIPLKSEEFYRENHIDLVLNTRVAALDVKARRVRLEDGREHSYGALLLATGAEPVRLNVPGADQPHVHYLRSFADSKALVAAASSAKRAVVVGASFIGLEVAASLRTRGLDVHVVAPEQVPMERVMGPDVGRFIQRLHESHGVAFHLGRTVSRIDGRHGHPERSKHPRWRHRRGRHRRQAASRTGAAG